MADENLDFIFDLSKRVSDHTGFDIRRIFVQLNTALGSSLTAIDLERATEIIIPNCLDHTTAFCRYPNQNLTIQKLIRARLARNQSTDVLVAGCADGREVYTIAAAAQQAVQSICNSAISPFHVTGRDISQTMIEKARKKILPIQYDEEISLLADLGQQVHSLGKSQGKCWICPPELVSRVTFEQRNFKDGLGIEDDKKPQVITLNNILYYLNDALSLGIFLEALKKVDSEKGFILMDQTSAPPITQLIANTHGIPLTPSSTYQLQFDDSLLVVREKDNIKLGYVSEESSFIYTGRTYSLETIEEKVEAVKRVIRTPNLNELRSIPRSFFLFPH